MFGRKSPRHGHHHERPSSRLKFAGIALAVVLVAGAGVVAVQVVRANSVATCDAVVKTTVAADPTIAPVLTDILSRTSDLDRGCHDFEITSEQASDTAKEIAGTAGSRPDLWVPDSTLWLLKTLSSTGTLPELAMTSVVNTLPVLVSRTGETPAAGTWLGVLQMPNQRIGDPLTSDPSLASILGAMSESEVGISDPKAVSAALVPMAQGFSAIKNTPHGINDLVAQVADTGGTSVSTEQAVVAYNAAHPGAAVSATVPSTGSYFLDYPMAITAAAGPTYDNAKKAGASLANVLATSSARDQELAAGFRLANGTALTGGRGVGSTASLVLQNPLTIAQILRDWSVLALPLRTIVVEDVSGSMKAQSGNSTRIGLTVDASIGGNALFNDDSEVGLWAFSIKLGGPTQDYRELVPIAELSTVADGIPQRERINNAIRTLPSIVGGGTALYDTALAAFRKVKEGYNPAFVNSVIILTDGSNDDPGSQTLPMLLATLQKEQDPVRPVVIITIGVTSDADPAALQQISTTTGGTSYIAADPRDIPEVFVEALNSRTARLGS